MRRRVPLQKLRGSDPTLLEVQIQDMLERPSGQLEPANLCDLFALAELDERPKSVRTQLDAFVKRCAAEIAEIPDGKSMVDFVDEFCEVEASRAPESLRSLITELIAREGRDSKELERLQTTWNAAPAEPFELGVSAVRVQKARVANQPDSLSKGITRAKAAPRKAAASKAKPKPVVDVDRRNWIVDTVMERLFTSEERGLGEKVLIAGIRHRAREEYPRLGPHEVTSVLNELLKVGRVRKSAGRWFRQR